MFAFGRRHGGEREGASSSTQTTETSNGGAVTKRKLHKWQQRAPQWPDSCYSSLFTPLSGARTTWRPNERGLDAVVTEVAAPLRHPTPFLRQQQRCTPTRAMYDVWPVATPLVAEVICSLLELSKWCVVRPCPAADTGGPILWIAGSAALTSVVPCNAGNCYIILLLDVQDSAADGIWHRKHWDCVMI
ncbi:hypothetical protein MRX96_002917 [Rhipicephalus microplus]